jgi:hypothetical protein
MTKGKSNFAVEKVSKDNQEIKVSMTSTGSNPHHVPVDVIN